MITVIHGNDNFSSRRSFSDLKTKDALTFDAESLDLVSLYQSIQGQGLFETGKKIFIENLFTRKAKNVDEIVKFLNENSSTVDVYVYADKELGAKSISQFEKTSDQNFKIRESIFTFLDTLKPNSSRNVTEFHKALGFAEPEIILFMLARQFRLLLSIDDQGSNIDEVKRLAPWQKTKLSRQASYFGKERLNRIHKKLYDLEKGQRTGSSTLKLVPSIDILLLEI